MDVLLDEDEELIRNSVRRFLTSECDPERVRRIEEGDGETSDALWREFGRLGWLGLALPEDVGGSDAPFTQLVLLFEEAGRALAPVPLHPHMVASLALGEALRQGSLGDLGHSLIVAAGAGDCVLTWAWSERSAGLDPRTITLSATPDGDGWRLNGQKRFVEAAEASDHCLVAARSETSDDPRQGITLLLVDLKSDGVRITKHPTLAGDEQAEIDFTNVRVERDALVGEPGEGWAVAGPMLEKALVLNCAMITGATRRAAERAFDYAKERVAFDHPIGSFQAIQHTCADMITWVDGAELLTREAAWHIARGLPAALPAAAAKAFTNERCQMVLREANQIHGGLAQIKEFDQQLWYRRAAAWSMRLGTAREHRATVARELGF